MRGKGKDKKLESGEQNRMEGSKRGNRKAEQQEIRPGPGELQSKSKGVGKKWEIEDRGAELASCPSNSTGKLPTKVN